MYDNATPDLVLTGGTVVSHDGRRRHDVAVRDGRIIAVGEDLAVEGAILLSPPLKRAGDEDLDAWAASGKPLLVLVPELDDYLRPDEARRRFARVPQAEVVAVDRAKHLWVGEPYVRIVLNEIVRLLNPAAWPLPTEWKD